MSAALNLIRSSLGGFLAWWFGELAGLVPRRLRATARRERQRLVLRLEGATVVLLEPEAGGEHELGRAELEAPGLEATLGAALARARGRRREVTIRLGAESGLRRVLDLPLAARANLDQLLQFEMDRLTPFRADQVYVAHRIASVDPAGKRLQAEIDVAPRQRVDQALGLARALGLKSKRVELAGASPERPALDLLPDETREHHRGNRVARVLALLTFVMAAAAIAVPLQRQQATASSLEAEVEAARVEAQKSLVLREQLDRLKQAGDFLVKGKRDRPLVTEIVAELTRVIPDQAYVSQLYIDQGSVQLHGLARTASDMIGQLEQSELFRAPRFRSPVTMDPGEGLERFHIEVEIQPGAES